METNYYLEYYNIEREHWWFKVRAKILMQHLLNLLPSTANLQILNIGVATGHTSLLLEQFGKVTSVEYDKTCAEFTQQKLNIPVIQASATDLPFLTNTFDVVCAFDVIEHIEKEQDAISEIKRVCKQNGIIFITVPAFMFLWSEHDIINHHFRRYTKNELAHYFPKSNIIFCSYFNALLFIPIAVFRILKNNILGLPKPEQAKSDFGKFKNGFLNQLFTFIFSFEVPILKRQIHLPFGVSLLLSAKNN